MDALNLSELGLYVSYVVVRTDRANQIIKRDPKEIPRRLRLLLLAVDGQQDLGTYSSNLKGFGEVQELITELIQMDMVRLVDPALARQQRMAGKSAEYMALDSVLSDLPLNDDTQHHASASGESGDDLFYSSTMPGGLERLVGYAQEQYPNYQPASVEHAAVPMAVQQEQIESLFAMLESVRSERTDLKQRMMRYKNLKAVSRNIHSQSIQLKAQVLRWKIISGLLALGLAVFIASCLYV